ncbi:uncharacterized protein LOC110945101 [Helianthus annuus]|uniref:uncharacterized protein LOC110945101 n=1 Tax=Helianthus annuus TaxID=4232 RepID=UPI000B8F6F5B|nr:uncharacterized protein LOC110945101 [Helianthus annuus]
MSNSQKRRRTFTKSLSSPDASTSVPIRPSFTSCTNEISNSTYIDNGDCTCICEHCNALFWYDEHVNAMSSNRACYNHCCKHGRVKLDSPSLPPAALLHLFNKSEFLDNIRTYNSMFSMTSFGGIVDDSINDGSAPYIFKIEGQIYHWLGSFYPTPNERPRFLQMYLYDTENEVSNRLSVFGNDSRSQLNSETVALLIQILESSNKLVKLFRNARDLCRSADVTSFYIRLYNSYNSLRYDNPTQGCIGAIISDPGPESNGFDIVIRYRVAGPQRINILHPLYMSLQYPLLFIHGESGWSRDLRLQGSSSNKNNTLTRNMFYCYQLHDRANTYSLLLRGGRLFQQYLVDAYVSIEQDRLNFHRYNQNALRSEYMQGVHDAVRCGDTERKDIGKRIILPCTFTGGPRYMYKHYQDALAICKVHGNPQYFITFTCNVKWPEIHRYITKFPILKSEDRPYVIARVFHMKVTSFVNFLKVRRPFGNVTAGNLFASHYIQNSISVIELYSCYLKIVHLCCSNLYTIEFQKRGLPHCHLLLWVDEAHKIKDAAQLDAYISAEIPDPIKEQTLYTIVTDFMIHGPCGIAKPNSLCMALGSCKKNFPKDYEPVTRFDDNGYARYKRRQSTHSVQKNGISLDNGYVVPYNRSLLLHFHAHINVEYCGWSMLIKYLFKYISKGTDRVKYTIKKTSTPPGNSTGNAAIEIDEIKDFVDSRFICPHESAWRIFNFMIHERNPSVQMLSVHLENRQNVTFKDNEKLENVLRNPNAGRTTLTEWWESTGKCWLRRLTNKTPAIGRLAYIHPSAGDVFYLRMLLSHQKGCRSFVDIRTVAGEVLPTYRIACEKLGLLEMTMNGHLR